MGIPWKEKPPYQCFDCIHCKKNSVGFFVCYLLVGHGFKYSVIESASAGFRGLPCAVRRAKFQK